MVPHETPKTPEELINLLEKIQKDAQTTDFFKKLFDHDPVASENRFLNETMQAMQLRILDSEQRCELAQKLNENLASDLANALDELDALKRTVVDSHGLLVTSPEKKASEVSVEESVVVPAFLRVMQAEQSLLDNFVYEDEDNEVIASLQRRLQVVPTGAKHLDDSCEVDIENENSIPQESSIAGNVSIQNQRRATGTLNAGGLNRMPQAIKTTNGMIRGKSTPVLASAVGSASVQGHDSKTKASQAQLHQQSKGNNQSALN